MTDRTQTRTNPVTGQVELKPEEIFRPNTMAFVDPDRRWVDPDGYRLSDRLWSSKASDRKQIETVLRAGIARGASPLETARAVESLLNPAYQPRRDPDTFRILPQSKQPPGVTTKTPRQGPGKGPFRPRNSGLGSYAARRLARTETTAAFGAATKMAAKSNALLEKIKWRLSGHHHDADQCDQNAENSSRGLKRGVYWVDELPRYPDHPHEMCTICPWVDDLDLFDATQRLRHYVNTGVLPGRDWDVPGERIIMLHTIPKPPSAPPAPTPAAPQDPAAMSDQDFRDAIDLHRLDWQNAKYPGEREQIARRAGELMHQRMMQNLGPEGREAYANYRRIQHEIQPLKAESDRWKMEMQRRILYPWERDASAAADQAYHARLGDVKAARAIFDGKAKGNPFYAATRQALEDSGRPVYKGKAAPGNFTASSAKTTVGQITKAAEAMPVEWWEASNAYGPLKSTGVKRGYYGHQSKVNPATGERYASELMLSGTDTAGKVKTGVHELGHRMEEVRPLITEAEYGFYKRRTAGESLQKIYPNGSAALQKEVARFDQFGNPYMGKDYGGQAYEILSMGMEDLMRQDGAMPQYLKPGTDDVPGTDDDYLHFILGIMAIG